MDLSSSILSLKKGFVDFGSNLKVVLVRKRGERIVIVGTS
jgi:hypothetical protein